MSSPALTGKEENITILHIFCKAFAEFLLGLVNVD